MVFSPSANRILSNDLISLRAKMAHEQRTRGSALAFGLSAVDDRLADRGLANDGLHEIVPASVKLNDDAAATMFVAGIAARFAAKPGVTVLWALSYFDLYGPGLEQVGLGPNCVMYAQGRRDREVLAMAEDGLRDGALACVVAEVKSADRTATRRLQLAASDGRTPMLLLRRHRSRGRCPLDEPSSAMTRWRIGSVSSAPLSHAGVARARWSVELVRQRNGAPFSCILEACDDKGCLALPAATADRAVTDNGTASKAA